MSQIDIKNPNEDLEIPKWVNEEYFAPILQKDEPDCVKILKFSTVAAIPAGENFTSVMVRVIMDLQMREGTRKSKTYILKTTLDEESGGKIFRELNFFPKEIKMYQKYIPEFEALFRDAGRNVQLAPKCLHYECGDDRTSIVFEDLKEAGFMNTDRLYGLDMTHMRLALKKLAELHAASAVWAERNGPYPKNYHTGFVNGTDGREMYKEMFKIRMESYKKAMTKWGLEEAEKYINKFPTVEQYWNCCMRSSEHDPDEFNVLNHGDLWSSNIMWKYLVPGGEIDELLFLDFQICKWGSPALDLLFFITISAAKDIRIKEFDHFVEIYHEYLVDCLMVLKFSRPMPKLRELQMAMYKENNTFHAFFAVFNHLVPILLPSDKDCNTHTLMRSDEFGENFRMRVYTNPLYVETMLDIFPFFHRRGLFNFDDFN